MTRHSYLELLKEDEDYPMEAVVLDIFDYFEAKIKALEEGLQIDSVIKLKNAIDGATEGLINTATLDLIYEYVDDFVNNFQAPKTCDGCVRKPLQGENYFDPCGQCKRFYADYYEAKESE